MTVEVTLLLGIFAYLMIGAFLGERGPQQIFFNSAPRLGARVEAHIVTGRGFVEPISQQKVRWIRPSGGAPTGTL